MTSEQLGMSDDETTGEPTVPVRFTWPGLATPAPDTRRPIEIASEKAWASGRHKPTRGADPVDPPRVKGGPGRGKGESTRPATQFVGNKNPFTGASVLKPETKRTPLDVAAMRITSDPIPATFSRCRDKYGPLFEQLKPGQAIACKPHEVAAVSVALRKWLKARSSKCTVLSSSKFSEGEGRVWMIGAKDELYATPAAATAPVVQPKRKGQGK